jgi:hypothetical protein
MLRIGSMHYASLATAGQARLPHHTPDTFMVDLPSRTHQRFGYTTIAVTSKGFTNRLDGGTQALVLLLMIRLAAMLIKPLPVDQQYAAELAYRT